MCIKNTSQAFGVVTKSFHWLVVVLIISLLTIGFIMTDLETSVDKFKLYGLHKSAGITVLCLVVVWMIWRAVNIRPTYPATMSRWQIFAAMANKYALVTLAVAMPITGWCMSSAFGFPVSVFGLFTLPDLIGPDKSLAKDLAEVHENLAWLLIMMMSAHAGAALLHHFYYKDTILRRMLPFSNRGKNV